MARRRGRSSQARARTRDRDRHRAARGARRATGRLAVADAKGERVGFLHILYVHPSARQLGVAAALVRATVDRLRAHGRDMLELEVLASNERARSVYERWGFAPAEITLAADIDTLVERLRSPRSEDQHSVTKSACKRP